MNRSHDEAENYLILTICFCIYRGGAGVSLLYTWTKHRKGSEIKPKIGVNLGS
jgi:hypothetical protein